jgi:hypothetical protein
MRVMMMVVAATMLGSTAGVQAQESAWKFRWKKGQTLTYRAEMTTQTNEIVPDGKLDTKSMMRLTKRWQVLDVDESGVATVQSSLAALRMEVQTASGETLLYDSAAPDTSTPELREQMAKFVGAPLATLRVDTLGRVIEVKESKFGPASRFEMELPFTIILPGVAVRQNQYWDRAYSITQEPPEGTGEKYAAVQRYTCQKADGATATIAVTTSLKTPPKALADQAPLLQLQPEGEAVFDIKNGRLQSVSLKVNKELQGHQGAGTSYKVQSMYTEEFVRPGYGHLQPKLRKGPGKAR